MNEKRAQNDVELNYNGEELVPDYTSAQPDDLPQAYLDSPAKISRMKRATEYIKSNFAKKLTLRQLARMSAMSEFHFVREFKRHNGITPMAYVTVVRIENAKRLIIIGHLPIGLIAMQCGFASQAHFSTTFKRVTRMTPTEYRDQRSS